MKLSDGKTYLNGMSDLVTVRLTHPDTDYPFTGDDYCRYMADGRYLDDVEPRPVDALNLIEEAMC